MISPFISECRRAYVVLSHRDVADLLDALGAAMGEQGVRWFLFGAQAAIVWGSPRLSADVDVTAEIDPAELNDYITTMRDHGFDVVFGDPDFVAQTRVIPFVHRASGMPLDVVLSGPGFEEDFLQRAIPVDIGGALVPVISPEDLIVTKILAGRPKDIEDIRGVINERRASLDIERIRMVLRLLEQALAQSDLLPLFEREWLVK
ncbi:MAG TPA: nucleotidyl transferase AbiEii/AbiGii toxin family protein [Thermoanaerobaculia bacterium]|jgi:predicted nucleotidyltransferase|nr:nucleotidyl transferase AbiEii/AbiGii toxin family protein [Thermoanaerobaculia bacterium]